MELFPRFRFPEFFRPRFFQIMIEVRHLAKNYGSKRAVDGVSFKVQRGDILGFLGPNGAGKSTTMKMMLGLIAPTSGTVNVLTQDDSP